MAGNLISSLITLSTNLLPSFTASAQVHSSSSSNSNNSEMRRACAVEEDLQRLMRTLKRIKATLYDAEEREIRDRSIKLWLKELKKVAYDAEDVLSEYRYEVTRLQLEEKPCHACGSHLQREEKPCHACGSHKRKQMQYIDSIPVGMVDRLKKIRSQFDEIAKDRDVLQLKESDGERRPNNKILRPPIGHMVDEASIFGRRDEIKEVINCILSEKEKPFSVISIVGKGGLGKTTIAQLVYTGLRGSLYIDSFGWVCVSEEFDIMRLIKTTIESVSSKPYNGVVELSPLQEELAKTVIGKTLLLVLDDVWNENQILWELFRDSFKEAKIVRILVTTRNEKVARVMETTTYIRPTNLPEHSCWLLFQHYAFSGTSYSASPHFVGMGREIMRKCGGLPLAVKSIASLLRLETNEERWIEILESDLWESNPSNDIFPALQISYVHLPPHLKPCFLFCSLYPKDYELKKMNLIELWISHGYIKSRGKRKIREIGGEYYEELKQRSFLDDFSNDSAYEHCKLHDMIHDLARLNSENEHYLVEINQPCDVKEVNVPEEAYHLYARGFMGYVNNILQQNMFGLRTLSTDLRQCSSDLEHEYCINITEAMDLNSKLSEYKECLGPSIHFNLTKFQALRVLELKGNSLATIPLSISKLKNLVHLSITSKRLEMLPLSIGLLYNLQTLFLDCCYLKYLPETIGDLVNLQFLDLRSSKVKNLPKSLWSLSNLLILGIECPDLEEVPFDIKNLCNLHVLRICSYEIQALPNTIGYLRSLEELNLFYGSDDVIGKNKLDYVPKGLVNFPAIKKIRANFRVKTIAWLKDMKDLEGKLSIKGLEKMSNLVDAQGANLKNKCKLETLDLCWDPEKDMSLPLHEKSELRLSIIPEACEGGLVDVEDADFSLLECLQPHPNLKKLLVRWYRSATIPVWMRDPFSLQSIQEVTLECCDNIQSLPFGNLRTLKNLNIESCFSIRVLQLERLPSQLEKLKIIYCGELELITGLNDLDMLAALEIKYCRGLKQLTMEGLELVESTEPFGDSPHEKLHIGRQSISSLTSLKIEYCDLLRVIPNGLIPSWPCFVCIHRCGCPDLPKRHESDLSEDFSADDQVLFNLFPD